MKLATPTTPFQELMDEQKNLFHDQIEKLLEIVAVQCQLTGVNPLSQEMAAGALSIKIGKRPRDLLNPKAVKYMHLVFSMKDAISKRETREISAQFGVTVTQVRDFFTGQRSRVRKFVRLSREKATKSPACDLTRDGTSTTLNPDITAEPVALEILPPALPNTDEGPSCSKWHEGLSGTAESDLHFVENIFGLLRKEESFSGQVKLLRWILKMKNPSVLNWFLTEGGLMILATWLCDAANEEQTSFLLVTLKLLDYLPMSKAHPVHMSAILQSVNRLRFYRTSDISHRARTLLSKWIGKKLFAKKSNGVKSASDLQDELLLKQSISEVMGNESWDLKNDNTEEAMKFLCDNPDYPRELDSTLPLKMLTASGDESNKRRGVMPSHTRERRKVQMVEHAGQRPAARSPQVARLTSTTQSRPLSADDIQKAKMRAQFMQSKHGKTIPCLDEKLKSESETNVVLSSSSPSVSKSIVQNETGEERKPDDSFSKIAQTPETSPVILEEPPWKKCKGIQIRWQKPPEMKIDETWRVGHGSNSKEVEVQKNRIRREREVIYRTMQEIPSDPREPWDREMDCDDSLTPVIPTDQLPDVETQETPPVAPSNMIVAPIATTSSESMPAPDFELLAELLKNPELVFALTSGQAGNLSSNETLKLLDMIKANGVSSLGNLAASKVEVSLPSPTPSSDPVPNGVKPDFSRNPFSRQYGFANGNAYHAAGAALPVQSRIPATTVLTPQPSATVQQFAHMVVPPVQTSIKLPEQWQSHTDSQVHHSRHNSSNTQHFTSEMMLNANTVANYNRAPSNALWADPVGSNVNPMPLSRSITPPRPVKPPNSLYMQESSNSMRSRQSFESNHHYPNNRTVNNYNAYAGGPSSGSWDGRNSLSGRPEYDSWSPDNSPTRRREHLLGQYHKESSGNSRNGYGHRNSMQPSGYRDVGNKRWQDHRR